MSLNGKVCVVTGASSGVGRALATAFARSGAQVWAMGRSRERLESLARKTAGAAGGLTPLIADFEDKDALEAAHVEIISNSDSLDVLVHSAGTISRGPIEHASTDHFDRQYQVNLRAPFVLTRALLPALKRSRGQIVFINSSAGSVASPDAALYAATKGGLKVFADSLRQEVNPAGVRVVTVTLGRTATPMQKLVHEHEGRAYRPELLLRPEDVVEVVLSALSLGPTAEVTDVKLRPLGKLP